MAWVAYLEEKYPILRAVSSLKMNQLEEELQEAILEKQRLNREILLMQLREQTYKEVAFNRLQNRTTYRELQHQVTKKKNLACTQAHGASCRRGFSADTLLVGIARNDFGGISAYARVF
ncbi:MAG: hypothetical protein R2822_11840 [Spirosomataceae bacterium]